MEALQQEVLSLEGGGDRKEAVRTIKRHFHTLKGDSATIGLMSVSRVVHRMEDLMGRLEGRVSDFTGDVIDLILKCVDEVAASIEKYRTSGDDTVPAYLEKLIDHVVGDISDKGAAYSIELNSSDKEKVSVASSEGKRIYRAIFTFSPDCKMKGAGGIDIGAPASWTPGDYKERSALRERRNRDERPHRVRHSEREPDRRIEVMVLRAGRYERCEYRALCRGGRQVIAGARAGRGGTLTRGQRGSYKGR